MRVTKVSTIRQCAICERTLLMGERAMRFSPDGHEYVDVCPLCQDAALEHGWVREGAPTTPTVANDPRKRRSLLTALFEPRRPASEPVAAEPILRRLSEPELAVVEAADLFNASTYRRTVEGIAKSLGEPQASIVPLSGVNAEMVVTIAWDLSWYQYRISLDGQQPVRLESRGYEIDELEQPYREWNARLGDDGRVVPDIARI
jgi:hypothetical protein